MTHTCRDTWGTLIPQCLTSLWAQHWFTIWHMPLHSPEPWPRAHPEHKVSSVGRAAHIAEQFEAWRAGHKRWRALPSPFPHPCGCRVDRLTSRTANSELWTSSSHYPATGCTSLLPNLWKSASRSDLLALREALPCYAMLIFTYSYCSYLLPCQNLVIKTQANQQCSF